MPDEKKATFTKIEDYNPDHQRSWSALFIEEDTDGIRYTMQVKGLGVIIMRAVYETDGTLIFKGLSTFSKSEIGYSPTI